MSPYIGDINKLLQELELLGETEVRRRLPSELYGAKGSPMRSIVDEWLDTKESARRVASEVREEEALEETRKANRLAEVASSLDKTDNRRASFATILAIIATIAAIMAIPGAMNLLNSIWSILMALFLDP